MTYATQLDYAATQEKLRQLCNVDIDLVNMNPNGRRDKTLRLCRRHGIAPVEKYELD